MNRILNLFLVIVTLTAAVSYAADTRLKTFVSITPQQQFVQKIGGSKVVVSVMVAPGRSPATYEPTPLQMARLTKSDLYFSIGVPFENVLLPKVKKVIKNLKVVDTGEGIKRRHIKAHHHGEEEHGEHHHDEHCEHEGNDPHIWLNPQLVKVQALNILKALQEADPDNKDYYEKNYNGYITSLDALDKELKEILAPVKGKTFMVFHPSWGYFADAYGLHQVAIEVSGKTPTARQLAEVVEEAKEENIKIIFVQPQFSKKSAQKVAQLIDGTVMPIDPLAYDYENNLKKAAKAVAEALTAQNAK